MASDITSQQVEDKVLRASIDRSLRHPVMFFFTSGAAWLALSLILGMVASAKSHSPGFLGDCGIFNYGRVFSAHMATFIYGWAAQAAFGTIIWLMARLSRQESKKSGVILSIGHAWNFVISLGSIGILLGGGTGKPWMYFPDWVWPLLIVCYFAIGIWSVIAFRVRRGGHVYISQWYLMAALFWFPWVFLSGNVFVNSFADAGNGVMAAGINAWFRSAMFFLFFTPVAIASAYYIAPKVTGRPVYSYKLALLGFWALAIIGPWAGMQKVMGAPIPVFLQYAGAAASILFIIPAICVGVNVLRTTTGKSETVAHSPSLRFTVAGIIGLIATAVVGGILSHPDALKYTQFAFGGTYGYEILALYGFFSMCMFGAIYFIVPRVTNREWIAGGLIRSHFWMSLYGVVFIGLFCGILGAFMHGYSLEALDVPGEASEDRLLAYTVGITVGWIFVALANVFFCFHLLMMWLRLGRRSSHPTLLEHHEPTLPPA
ncbi:cbb3-type cytochrome c oxidase subunit I [Rubritalea marina]|uniref:cbb3-type cytochrome c oxidase subunit I n=1 Tax=Rubritalea marina TaxID=361055 RepID=UPI000369228E|nr:cbb3-type cytochrome c oxidase subunit I [Rubritalea marina]